MKYASGLSDESKISRVEVTPDLLADRGGMAPFMNYIDRIYIIDAIATLLQKFRTGNKGVPVLILIRQILAFFMEGSSRHLTWFDHLKEDPGYGAVLETPSEQMISSHQVKRFFHKLPFWLWSGFRLLLRRMFATRLVQDKPEVVELFLDTMVLDNDDALARQGCQPTYKKVKGFQPLQLIWNGMIIDAQFRGGSKNGNHGDTAFQMIDKAAKVIRKHLGYSVPILVRMDGGFFDGKLFSSLDSTGLGFVCSGKLSAVIKEFASQQAQWQDLDTRKQRWSYFEFGTRCHKWDRFYRAFYLKPLYDQDQMVLDFARPENVILTNMGAYPYLFQSVDPSLRERLYSVDNVIAQHHAKGADELTHRALKDFGFEQMPFKKFGANAAFYYMMAIAFNLMEWYKRDVLVDLDLVDAGSYATTIRRKVIDFAAKIVKTGHEVILKVTANTMKRLRLDELWQKCREAPPLLI